MPRPHLPLTEELRSRVVAALQAEELDVLLLAGAENVGYVTGYRSLSETMRRDPTIMAALAADGSLDMVAPAADAGPVLHDSVVDPDRFVPYGRFFFESPSAAPASSVSDVHASFPDAVRTLMQRNPGRRIGADGPALSVLAKACPEVEARDMSVWMVELRSVKVSAEVVRLRRAAALTEAAMERAFGMIEPGVTEREVANQIASDLAAGGANPRFIVVTFGERSALSDASATDRAAQHGDIVRFDIGSVLDGYWADLGRTGVLGTPTPLQQRRYDALLAGEQAQIQAAAPGVLASELFSIAHRTVEQAGIRPYRRHHCGHAIGSEVYERPIVAPGWDTPLREGMTLCLETPFYDLGWGGMMVEDTVVITEDGCESLSVSDRRLRVL